MLACRSSDTCGAVDSLQQGRDPLLPGRRVNGEGTLVVLTTEYGIQQLHLRGRLVSRPVVLSGGSGPRSGCLVKLPGN